MRTTGKATDLITFSRSSGGTYLDSDGVLKTAAADIPRIEYDADGSVKGLLIEESRTNLITNSDDVRKSIARVSFSANVSISPDGSVSADRMSGNGASGSHYQYFNSASAGTNAQSVYVKYVDTQWVQLAHTSNANQYANFDIINGVVGSAGAGVLQHTIEEVGNGWYRISAVHDLASTALWAIALVSSGTDAWLAASTLSTSVDLYGWQLEAGAFPTSYIPTSGSTATRAADVASIATSAFGHRQGEGTLIATVETFDADYSSYAWVINGTDDTFAYSHSSGTWRIAGAGGTVAYVGSLPSSNFFKIGYTFDESGSATLVDGGSVTSVSHSQPTQAHTINIGTTAGSGGQLNGHIKSIKYYPRRLTNAQLQELTT